MNRYETTTTVDANGQVRVTHVPFQPGTEVQVTIKSASEGDVTICNRLPRLLESLDKGQNQQPVGPLGREELYDRQGLH